MTDDAKSPVYTGRLDDAEIERAARSAAASFKYLWRELTWEYRRIVPGLELAAIKLPFRGVTDGIDDVEHMWLSEIEFDGDVVSATLLNSPHRITTVAKDDRVEFTAAQIEDWMYVMSGRVYGGYTIQVLRGRMSPSERQSHDEAWGFEFPEPAIVEVAPRWSGVASSPDEEHPMSQNMAPGLAKAVEDNRAAFFERGPSGLNTLHSLALGGSLAGVKVLLELGADPHMKTNSGKTARALAEQMGWQRVAEVLGAAEQRT